MKKTRILLFSSLLSILFVFNVNAQDYIGSKSNISSLLQKHKAEFSLEDADLEGFIITDQYTSEHNGVTHVFLNQTVNGVKIYNAILNLNIKNGELLFHGNQFVKDAAKKVNTAKPSIEPEEALVAFAQYKGVRPETPIRLKSNIGLNKYEFQQPKYSRRNIPVELVYQVTEDGSLRLAWQLEVPMSQNHDYWDMKIDAADGSVLAEYNLTLKCSFENHGLNQCIDDLSQRKLKTPVLPPFTPISGDGAQYRVYPAPVESPIHGDAQLVIDPAFAEASPYGWHDLDGVAGGDTTITLGNNVHAFLDKDDNDEPDIVVDGGESLVFDFEHRKEMEPDSSVQAEITNLFYWNNYIHDFAYLFGFNEVSGNFQRNNYGKGGADNDAVIANAQDGYSLNPVDNSNNAFFSPPRDGQPGYMGMFIWTQSSGSDVLEVVAPESIAGSFETGDAAFGLPVGRTPLMGKVVLALDSRSTKTDACSEIVNIGAVENNIALIDRGECFFSEKVWNAEMAGAKAALICNVPGAGGDGEELISMGSSTNGNLVSIPSLFMRASDCDLIRSVIKAGTDVVVNLQIQGEESTGPANLSSAFDNGIIAHEYGHGISTRLTGGPSNSSCLNNDEQMGEGWSDYVTLVTAHREGALGSDARGIGNYVIKGNIDSRGIRRKPYSTDFSINNQTMDNIKGTGSPHALGEVWTSVLWDLYWSFIDIYGFNEDLSVKTSGNFRAVQLVFDGMKMQPCLPGFTQGRDAILAADRALYNGEHQCMIWGVFANRGIGYDAIGGSTSNRNDNKNGFEPLPTCIKELKIKKTMTDIINPGDEIEVTLELFNHKEEAVNNVLVTDVLPPGTSLTAGSSNVDATVDNGMIVFDLGTLNSLEETVITYKLSTDPSVISAGTLFEDFEFFDSPLFLQFPIEGEVEWEYIDYEAKSGTHAWYMREVSTEDTDQGLAMVQTVKLDQNRPALRFFHRYDTTEGVNGGFVEVSTDGGEEFERLNAEDFVKNGYNSDIAFSTLPIPGLKGFSGKSEGYVESYLDLSTYKGQDVIIRFRFASGVDSDISSGQFPGWIIDDFEIFDLEEYKGASACITSVEGDMACADANTIVAPAIISDTNDETIDAYSIKIYPNPADTEVNIDFLSPSNGQGYIQVMSLDGKQVIKRNINTFSGKNTLQISTADLSSGMYLLFINAPDFQASSKIVVQE